MSRVNGTLDVLIRSPPAIRPFPVRLRTDFKPARSTPTTMPRMPNGISMGDRTGKRRFPCRPAQSLRVSLPEIPPVQSCTGVAMKTDPRDQSLEACTTPIHSAVSRLRLRRTSLAHRDPALNVHGGHSRPQTERGSGTGAILEVTLSSASSTLTQSRGPTTATNQCPTSFPVATTNETFAGSLPRSIVSFATVQGNVHASSKTLGTRIWVGEVPRFRWAISSPTMLMAISGTV